LAVPSAATWRLALLSQPKMNSYSASRLFWHPRI
jgi:hypothetical protein